jgi:hypothetical protein
MIGVRDLSLPCDVAGFSGEIGSTDATGCNIIVRNQGRIVTGPAVLREIVKAEPIARALIVERVRAIRTSFHLQLL